MYNVSNISSSLAIPHDVSGSSQNPVAPPTQQRPQVIPADGNFKYRRPFLQATDSAKNSRDSKIQDLLATKNQLTSFGNRVRNEVHRIQNDPELSQGQKNGEISMLEGQYTRNLNRIRQIDAELANLGYSDSSENPNSVSSPSGIDSLGGGRIL